MQTGKYYPLHEYLGAPGLDVRRLKFSEIEEIIGFSLPRSARAYAAWWANDPNTDRHSNSWLSAGWKTEEVDLAGEAVTFRRADQKSHLEVNAVVTVRSSGEVATADQLSDAPDGAVTIAVAMRWKRLGSVFVDEAGKLRFPQASAQPALYRLRLDGQEGFRHYIGEAMNLRRRFGNYRNPGPTQATSLRINEILRTHLSAGGYVEVDLIASEIDLMVGGGAKIVDLSNKATRRLLEQAAVVSNAAIDIESLNR